MAKPAPATATPSVSELLRCPSCSSQLTQEAGTLVCAHGGCGKRFPIVDGVPILIDETRSLFRISEIAAAGRQGSDERSIWDRLLPRLTANVNSAQNYEQLAALLVERGSSARVLIIGGGIRGAGMEPLFAAPGLGLVETDVMPSARTRYVCDGHDLPFADQAFDAVVLQAVLEHVVDPHRVVAEVFRVLRSDGLVYAETPFMQQVHAAELDFMRFSELGHRRLFRDFGEIKRGAAAGPGSALAWAYQHLLLSFAVGVRSRRALTAFARVSAFWLKYIDHWVADKPAALDAASSVYFLGRKAGDTLSDRELIVGFRGMRSKGVTTDRTGHPTQ